MVWLQFGVLELLLVAVVDVETFFVTDEDFEDFSVLKRTHAVGVDLVGLQLCL